MLKVLVYTQLSPVLDMLADDVVVEFPISCELLVPHGSVFHPFGPIPHPQIFNVLVCELEKF